MIFLLGILSTFCVQLIFSLSCLDENNANIGWVIGYKLPDSFNYNYFDSKNPSWTASENMINNGGTLKNIMEAGFKTNRRNNTMFSMYNDEKSGEKYSLKYGHMKGLLAFDKTENSGFWLIHSIPKLSDDPFSYRYPASGRIYGQHFLCITLDYQHLGEIVNLLKYSRPYVQSSWLSDEILKEFPDMADINANNRFDMKETFDVAKLSTLGNEPIEVFSFSKSKSFEKDIYEDLVAKSFNISLKVETWQHGERVLPSDCHEKYNVLNVAEVSFESYKISDTFRNEQDHSKWAVSFNQDDQKIKDIVCLGDINRMPSQFHRGGGTACLVKEGIWENFKDLVRKSVPCKD